MVSAFLKTSGVDLLIDDLRDALARGALVRLLTGDYLGISSADALWMLPRLADEHAEFKPFFFETLYGSSFHPKSYIFFRGLPGVACVGSSNLSRSALEDAVEWNLRLISSQDAPKFAAITARFEALPASPSTKCQGPPFRILPGSATRILSSARSTSGDPGRTPRGWRGRPNGSEVERETIIG